MGAMGSAQGPGIVYLKQALAYVTLRAARRQFEPFNCSKSSPVRAGKGVLPL
jgi:hypothetical protein